MAKKIARSSGAVGQADGEEGQQQAGKEQAAEPRQGDGGKGGIDAAHLARQDLIGAIGQRVDQHQHRAPLHHRRAGADDDQRAQEAEDHGGPAPQADLLAQQRARKAR